MKARRAWLACSVVTATYFIASCGSEDGKKNVRHVTDAGAGGEAGDEVGAGGSIAEAGGGGQAGAAAGEASPAGGAGGGAPPISGGAGGEPASGGAGGAGGAPISLFCFDRASVGGAGGAEAAGGAAPFELAFRCSNLQAAYGASELKSYESDTSTVVLPRLPGMEAAIKGRAVVDYNDACSQLDLTVKPETLEIALSATPLTTDVRVRWLELDDECGQTVAMDASGSDANFCWGISVYGDDAEGWYLDCYEGYATMCGSDCPTE